MKVSIKPIGREQSGFITLVLIVLLGIMAGFAIQNAIALHQLKNEIRAVEKRQVQSHMQRTAKTPPPP